MTATIGDELVGLLSHLVIACASFGCLYLLVASVAVLRFSRNEARRVDRSRPITVLKPLHGPEPGLSERLASLCRQQYDGTVQIICGVRDRNDRAVDTVEQLIAGGTPIELTVDGREHGENRKVSNLINMVSHARHDIVVIADSDIEVGPDYLASLSAELQAPGVGAVTCLYHGVPAAGIWSRCAALSINAHFLPNAVVAIVLGLAQPCFGATIAMRRSTLAAIGGLQGVADDLADDHVMGKAVQRMGSKVLVAPFSVGHVCWHHSLRSLMAHELRAARTIKTLDPVGYFGTMVSHPFPLALIAALCGAEHGVQLAAVALACRLTVSACVAYAFKLPWQARLVPVQDVLAFAVFVASFFGRGITWRGYKGRVQPDGRLASDERQATP
jgi:ceramide glucosyltransferase